MKTHSPGNSMGILGAYENACASVAKWSNTKTAEEKRLINLFLRITYIAGVQAFHNYEYVDKKENPAAQVRHSLIELLDSIENNQCSCNHCSLIAKELTEWCDEVKEAQKIVDFNFEKQKIIMRRQQLNGFDDRGA